jgi:hypothetical protein
MIKEAIAFIHICIIPFLLKFFVYPQDGFNAGPPTPAIGSSAKTLNKKTVQHNVDDDILTKQCFPRAHR